jgi:predicted ATP-grasp superfamily ATP-dependent carboligase
MASVLVLDGDTRQCLPVIRALKRLGHSVTVACPSRLSLGWMSRFPDRRLLLPPPDEGDGEPFVAALHEVVVRERPDVTLPLFDPCAHAVARHREAWADWTRIPIVDLDTFMLARDKAKTMRVCHAAGVPAPSTWFPEDEPIARIAEKASYPVLIKPRISHGAVGIVRVERAADLEAAVARVVAERGPCIVQEFIPQDGLQYKAQLFRGAEGQLHAAVVFEKTRWFPVDGGTSSLNRTVHRPDIVDTGRRLLEAMHWIGYADIDLIQDTREGVAKVMEVNPRVTGSVKITFEAGVDFADLLVRQALCQPLPTYDTYRVGISMRYLPLDILWFLYSPDRFRAKPSWFKFFGRDQCEQVFSWSDPGPFLALTLDGIRRLMSPTVRAAKLRPKSHAPATRGTAHAPPR